MYLACVRCHVISRQNHLQTFLIRIQARWYETNFSFYLKPSACSLEENTIIPRLTLGQPDVLRKPVLGMDLFSFFMIWC